MSARSSGPALEQKETDRRERKDQTPKAVACYGVYAPDAPPHLRAGFGPSCPPMLVRFCQGRPTSALTVAFLDDLLSKAASAGARAVALVWDNASWHLSREVSAWVRGHNRHTKRTGQGTRLLVCPLPSRSPWLNRIEPKWMHAKRAVCEPQTVLTGEQLAKRVCRYYTNQQHEWLTPRPS